MSRVFLVVDTLVVQTVTDLEADVTVVLDRGDRVGIPLVARLYPAIYAIADGNLAISPALEPLDDFRFGSTRVDATSYGHDDADNGARSLEDYDAYRTVAVVTHFTPNEIQTRTIINYITKNEYYNTIDTLLTLCDGGCGTYNEAITQANGEV